MDSNRIDQLLQRYWDCETTLEEEKELRDFFRQPTIPEQHKEAATLFRYFDAQKGHTLNEASFETVVKQKSHRPNGRLVTLAYNSMRIAAGIAVLVLATWLVRNEIRTNDPAAVEDSYDDPKLAFEETKKALLMISKSFETAESKARKLDLLNEAKEQVQKEQTEQKL